MEQKHMGLLNRLFRPKRAALEDALNTLARIVDDDEYQKRLLPESLRAMMKTGGAVDVLPDARGPFGLW